MVDADTAHEIVRVRRDDLRRDAPDAGHECVRIGAPCPERPGEHNLFTEHASHADRQTRLETAEGFRERGIRGPAGLVADSASNDGLEVIRTHELVDLSRRVGEGFRPDAERGLVGTCDGLPSWPAATRMVASGGQQSPILHRG